MHRHIWRDKRTEKSDKKYRVCIGCDLIDLMGEGRYILNTLKGIR